MRSLVILASLATTACAGTIAPRTTPAAPAREALLVLPGFGYGAKAERTLKTLAPSLSSDGIDLYVPTYLERGGLDKSRAELRSFVRAQNLERYERVHVFAFLAGGWTFNSVVEDVELLPNLATVVYDRSPYQERAPRVATEKLAPFAWLRYGSVIFDLAKQPYSPLPREAIKVGIVVETVPTGFIKRFRETAASYGPYSFECDSLGQRHDDCIFLGLNHGEMYSRFADIWPEVRAFIHSGRFSASAARTPPEPDAQRGHAR